MRGIYKITNTANGKSYIGKSEDLASRIKRHIDTLRNGCNRNTHMQNAYDLVDKDTFTIEIIEEVPEDVDINERERYWIEFYGTYDKEKGYNKTKGGDGGNSYVDCMTDEEKEAHWQKHREVRLGENNAIYGKHLYTDGIQQKYLSDEEAAPYIEQGWRKGANSKFKQTMSGLFTGADNPFYGKKHSKESIEKAKTTKEQNGFSLVGAKRYHKNGVNKTIYPWEEEEYLANGWEPGFDNATKEKIRNSIKENHQDNEWMQRHKQKTCNHYVYHGMDFYGVKDLVGYLRSHGYPTIDGNAISKISNGKPSTKYSELLKEITLIKKGE